MKTFWHIIKPDQMLFMLTLMLILALSQFCATSKDVASESIDRGSGRNEDPNLKENRGFKHDTVTNGVYIKYPEKAHDTEPTMGPDSLSKETLDR